MKRAPCLLGFSLLFFSFSCSHAVPEETLAKSPSRLAIATIQTRDGKVTLLGGGPDLRVMVRNADGQVITADASLDDLRARDPLTWSIVTRAVASGDGSGNYLDASR